MTKSNDSRLHWIKFNPSEWLGICAGLEDAEIGMFHRIVEKLWATPGNTMLREDLMQRLRIKAGTESETRFIGLIGCVIFVDEFDCVSIPQLHEAFASVVSRKESAKKAADTLWAKKRGAQEKPLTGFEASDEDGTSYDYNY